MNFPVRLSLLMLVAVILALAIAYFSPVDQIMPTTPMARDGSTGYTTGPTTADIPQQSAQRSAPRLPVGEVLRISELQHQLEAIGTERFQRSDREQARDYIAAALRASGWVVTRQAINIEGRVADASTPDAEIGGINIIATRPGQSIAGSIVLGAHYDTVAGSPGADDNGTGVVAALEAARLLGPLPAPRSLTLVFFDLEERGLIGSQAFVDAFPDVAGAVILEMLGFSCSEPGCQRYPAGLPITPSQTTGDFLAAVGDRAHLDLIDAFRDGPDAGSLSVLTLAVPTLGPLAPDLLRSDHVPFWRAGIGAVMLTDTAEFRNPHYHRPSDQVQTIDFGFFRSAVQLVVERLDHLLWTL